MPFGTSDTLFFVNSVGATGGISIHAPPLSSFPFNTYITNPTVITSDLNNVMGYPTSFVLANALIASATNPATITPINDFLQGGLFTLTAMDSSTVFNLLSVASPPSSLLTISSPDASGNLLLPSIQQSSYFITIPSSVDGTYPVIDTANYFVVANGSISYYECDADQNGFEVFNAVTLTTPTPIVLTTFFASIGPNTVNPNGTRQVIVSFLG
jgi:hypothetical protein